MSKDKEKSPIVIFKIMNKNAAIQIMGSNKDMPKTSLLREITGNSKAVT